MRSLIDTSTLISLARIASLELLHKLKIHVIVPDKVYEEAVIRGVEKGLADAMAIKSFINTYKLKIVGIKSHGRDILRRKIGKTLAGGDEALLSLALTERVKVVITNDDGLGKIAMGLGFRVLATPDLLLRGLRDRVIDFREFEVFLRSLVVENRLGAAVAELYLLEGKQHVEG